VVSQEPKTVVKSAEPSRVKTTQREPRTTQLQKKTTQLRTPTKRRPSLSVVKLERVSLKNRSMPESVKTINSRERLASLPLWILKIDQLKTANSMLLGENLSCLSATETLMAIPLISTKMRKPLLDTSLLWPSSLPIPRKEARSLSVQSTQPLRRSNSNRRLELIITCLNAFSEL